jgi:hypothetical protein
MKNKANYVVIDDVLDLCDGKSIEKITAEEFDKMVSKDIVAVFKKHFPNSMIDEKRVMKLARMLIAEETKKGGN